MRPLTFASRARLGVGILAALALLSAVAAAAPKKPRQSVGSTIKMHRMAVATALINPAKMLVTDPNWLDAEREIDADQAQMKEQLRKLGEVQVSHYVVRRGNRSGSKLALTFDDGPHPEYTPKLVQILKAANVPATFFVIGHMAEQYPDMVKLLESSGFEVGNHTYSHVTLTKITPEQASIEYRADNDVLKRIIGKPARYCRPPGGDFNLSVLDAAAGENLKTVLWTDDPGDYSNPGDNILLEKETAKISPGGIVLLHDGSQDTVDTLAKFIASCKRRGFTFVTLDELQKR